MQSVSSEWKKTTARTSFPSLSSLLTKLSETLSVQRHTLSVFNLNILKEEQSQRPGRQSDGWEKCQRKKTKLLLQQTNNTSSSKNSSKKISGAEAGSPKWQQGDRQRIFWLKRARENQLASSSSSSTAITKSQQKIAGSFSSRVDWISSPPAVVFAALVF